MAQEPPHSADLQRKNAAASVGERGFVVGMALVGALALWQAFSLWQAMEEPRIASAAVLPLAAGTLWFALALLEVILLFIRSPRRQADCTLRDRLNAILPMPVRVTVLMILGYCACLLLHVPFYVCTPVFLYAGMCYHSRGKCLKNAIWTACCMAFLYLVFDVLFGVVTP